MKTIFLAEVLLTIGIVLFSFSLFIFGMIIRRLLRMIKRHGIWTLLMLGSVLLLAGAVVHIIKLSVYFPALARTEPYKLLPLIATTMKVGTIEALMILLAGIFTIIASLIYFNWTNK